MYARYDTELGKYAFYFFNQLDLNKCMYVCMMAKFLCMYVCMIIFSMLPGHQKLRAYHCELYATQEEASEQYEERYLP